MDNERIRQISELASKIDELKILLLNTDKNTQAINIGDYVNVDAFGVPLDSFKIPFYKLYQMQDASYFNKPTENTGNKTVETVNDKPVVSDKPAEKVGDVNLGSNKTIEAGNDKPIICKSELESKYDDISDAEDGVLVNKIIETSVSTGKYIESSTEEKRSDVISDINSDNTKLVLVAAKHLEKVDQFIAHPPVINQAEPVKSAIVNQLNINNTDSTSNCDKPVESKCDKTLSPICTESVPTVNTKQKQVQTDEQKIMKKFSDMTFEEALGYISDKMLKSIVDGFIDYLDETLLDNVVQEDFQNISSKKMTIVIRNSVLCKLFVENKDYSSRIKDMLNSRLKHINVEKIYYSQEKKRVLLVIT